jgi:hypothetical protein
MQAVFHPGFSNSNQKFDIKSSFTEEEQEDNAGYEVCLANISPVERRKRLRFGIVQFAISLVVLVAMLVLGVDKIWRLPLFFLFSAAAVGYFQWRDKT